MKKQIAVIFGGQSSEHEVSCISAANVIEGLQPDKYQVHIIGITKEGSWLYVDDLQKVKDGSWKEGTTTAIISPETAGYLEDGCRSGRSDRGRCDLSCVTWTLW